MMPDRPAALVLLRRATAPLLAVGLAATLAACQGGGRDEAVDTAAVSPAPVPSGAAGADSGATGATGAGTGATTGAAAAGAAIGAAATEGALLDPNAATREELLAVPGMSATAADALVAGRPYANMVAVDRALAGAKVSDADRKTVYARLWKPLDLNSAPGEEIVLIPGVGPRMRHEFEEYRPYRSIEQFRREIGKYVNAAEVARLERYVTIR
jgi:DNA uptake protein ComE-like DNA-binding protein